MKRIKVDNNNCALEELDLFLAQWDIPLDQREWLLKWANRRSENVNGWLIETLEQIEHNAGTLHTARYLAARALRTCAAEKKG